MRDVSVVGAGAMGSALVEVLAGSGAEVMVWNRTATKAFQRLQDADTDDEVGAAWVALDLLRRMYRAPDRDTAHRRLVTFYEWPSPSRSTRSPGSPPRSTPGRKRCSRSSTPEPATHLPVRHYQEPGSGCRRRR
jgi:cation diffusion facilitator CzcD-associated flavoprotein CzcO